ncbi:hypothetical protein [Fibrobacter sp. UBA3629]|uniref:hypothetical protein n=1 Tax=Fibrobacter sp. UBA3629 TaxID=1946530 RepID=UPI0025C59D3E|nr:hypothetical protein [Fibrobacter sp. UBA3629]
MFCPNCGEHYNYDEPRCPWCGASKPHKESSNEKDETVEIDEKKLPLKTRLFSKRYVAALILFIIGITCLTVITRNAFIVEYPDTIDYNSPYFIAFVFLICIPFLGVLGFMYDSEQKRNPRDDSKNDLGSMFITQLQFYYLAPFKYGYRCIKERNYKGLVLFATFISALAFLFAW